MAQQDKDSEYFWNGIPTIQQETELIQSKAKIWRDKMRPEPNPWRPGFDRRSQRGRTEVFQNLAALQKRYSATDDRDEIRRIGTRAMLLLIPMLGFGQKRLCQHTGLPCNRRRNTYRFKKGWGAEINCQLREGRHEIVWQILTHFVQKQAPHSNMLGFSMPILSVRWREYEELWSGAKFSDAQRSRDQRENTVGMAVLMEYKSHRHEPGNGIDAAFNAIATNGSVDGEQCGGFDNVRKLYKEYRKQALWRGYADERAFIAECRGDAWPNDQLWLSDFPRQARG